MKITHFEDLDCWQEATSLAIDIYKITSEGDFGKDYGLRDQLRRAAVSIASNIARFSLFSLSHVSRIQPFSRSTQTR